MTIEELREEISIELEYMGATVKESVELLNDFSVKNPALCRQSQTTLQNCPREYIHPSPLISHQIFISEGNFIDGAV
jgi:hypothetical protein